MCYRPDPQAELVAPGLRVHAPEAGGDQPKPGAGCGAQGSPHTAKRHRTAPASPTRPVPTPPSAPTHSSIFPRYLLGVGQVSLPSRLPRLPPARRRGGGAAGGRSRDWRLRPPRRKYRRPRGCPAALGGTSTAGCAVSSCRRCCLGLSAERVRWFSP